VLASSVTIGSVTAAAFGATSLEAALATFGAALARLAVGSATAAALGATFDVTTFGPVTSFATDLAAFGAAVACRTAVSFDAVVVALRLFRFVVDLDVPSRAPAFGAWLAASAASPAAVSFATFAASR
jgi:hypothetical protein